MHIWWCMLLHSVAPKRLCMHSAQDTPPPALGNSRITPCFSVHYCHPAHVTHRTMLPCSILMSDFTSSRAMLAM